MLGEVLQSLRVWSCFFQLMGLGGGEDLVIKVELSVYMNFCTSSVNDFSPSELYCPDI